MGRQLHRLTALTLKRNKAGLYADGGGLYLQVTEGTDGGLRRSWLFRYKIAPNKDRWHGLGPLHTISLREARDAALHCRKQRLAGKDPIEVCRAERAARVAASAQQLSFEQCTRAYVDRHSRSWRNAKHVREWPRSLDNHIHPTLGKLPVAVIDTPLVLKAIRPLWEQHPETAKRVLGRVAAVLDWATASKLRVGDNPARWTGLFEHLLPARAGAVAHLAAMDYRALPQFMVKLRARNTVAARALEFAICTAARSGEALGCEWREIDLASKTWTVPLQRMKSGRQHQVPLAPRAVEILEQMAALRQGEGGLVFPGRNGESRLGPTSFRETLRALGHSDVTTHGFRSSFRDWCGDCTTFPREVAEAALAHAIGDRAEQAYRRNSALQKRAALMAAWNRFLAEPAPAGEVVDLPLRRTP